jgi:hypothetical protein
MLFSFWFHQTKLYKRIAVHLCVRTGGLLGKQLSTNETFPQSVAADDEQLADLVGAVSATAILGLHAKKSLQDCYLLDKCYARGNGTATSLGSPKAAAVGATPLETASRSSFKTLHTEAFEMRWVPAS